MLICTSVHHGNTRKIAEAMAEAVGGETCTPLEMYPRLIDKYEVIGLGSGIYFGKHHKSLFKLLDKVCLKNKKVFIFYTSGISRIPFLNGCEDALRRALIVRGARILGIFGCRGYCDHGLFKLVEGINRGRPNEEDLDRARAFIFKTLGLKPK